MADLVLRADAMLDCTGRDLVADVALAVDGERIAAIAEDGADGPPGEVLELDGCTLLPGLVDLHTHMGVLNVAQQDTTPAAVVAAMVFRNAELCLLSGHTSAREVAGADGGLRSAIDLGLVPGPRLWPSGPLLCQTGGHGHFAAPFALHDHDRTVFGVPGLSQFSEVCDGPDGVRLAARRAFRHGATQLKVCVSGGVVSLTDEIDDVQFSVAELTAAVEEAAARGTYVTAHAHGSASIEQGLDAGLRCFEHGSFLTEATAARMAREGAVLVPTLSVLDLAADNAAAWGVPAEVLPRFEGVLDASRESLRIALAAGVTVGSGTDILGPEQGRRGRELALKAEVMGARAAIESATRVSAGVLGRGDDLGTLQVGRLADVIAVAGDPVADPGLLEDPDNVVVVVKGGRVVKDLR